MRTAGTLAAMLVLLAIGSSMMFYNFQDLIVHHSLGLSLLGFFTGLLCLVAGICVGVVFLRRIYEI
jgi:hypothetical protein